MKYYVFKAGGVKRGEQPVKILEYDPGEFMIGALASEFGPIEVHPEMIEVKNREKTAVEQAEPEIKAMLPPGVKTDWNK